MSNGEVFKTDISGRRNYILQKVDFPFEKPNEKIISIFQDKMRNNFEFRIPWEIERLIWIGSLDQESILSKLPKDVVKYMLAFCVGVEFYYSYRISRSLITTNNMISNAINTLMRPSSNKPKKRKRIFWYNKEFDV